MNAELISFKQKEVNLPQHVLIRYRRFQPRAYDFGVGTNDYSSVLEEFNKRLKQYQEIYQLQAEAGVLQSRISIWDNLLIELQKIENDNDIQSALRKLKNMIQEQKEYENALLQSKINTLSTKGASYISITVPSVSNKKNITTIDEVQNVVQNQNQKNNENNIATKDTESIKKSTESTSLTTFAQPVVQPRPTYIYESAIPSTVTKTTGYIMPEGNTVPLYQVTVQPVGGNALHGKQTFITPIASSTYQQIQPSSVFELFGSLLKPLFG